MLSPYYYKLPENVTLSRFLTGVVEGKKYFKTFIISMTHLSSYLMQIIRTCIQLFRNKTYVNFLLPFLIKGQHSDYFLPQAIIYS
jgi:hypothetical protein